MSKSDLQKITTLRDYEKLLTGNGYKLHNGNANHRVYGMSGKPTISLPNHKGQLSPGVKRNVDKLILGESYYNKRED